MAGGTTVSPIGHNPKGSRDPVQRTVVERSEDDPSCTTVKPLPEGFEPKSSSLLTLRARIAAHSSPAVPFFRAPKLSTEALRRHFENAEALPRPLSKLLAESEHIRNIFRTMGNKTFRDLRDFSRHGVNLLVTCRCRHEGYVDAGRASEWFRAHRWPQALDMGLAHQRFRCSRCGQTGAVSIRPADPVTALSFPKWGDADAWKRLVRRLRG